MSATPWASGSQIHHCSARSLTMTQEFLFYPANHSVVRAPYLHPCIPYEMGGIGRVGFNSGFQPVKAITSDVCSITSSPIA